MLLDEIRDHLYQANHTWLSSVRRHLSRTILDGLTEAFSNSKPHSFLSHPVPECSCMSHESLQSSESSLGSSSHLKAQVSLGIERKCPAWMDSDIPLLDVENEEELSDDDPISGQFFQQNNSSEIVGGEMGNKEDARMEDQEELEGGER